MRPRRTCLPLAAAAVILAVPAHADAGTALMWLGTGHLLLGNLLIGLAEWGLLVWLAGQRRRPSGWSAFAIVAGNYVSAWAGVFLIQGAFEPRIGSGIARLIAHYFPQPLYQATQIIALSWLCFFVLTVIIEWGFVHWGMAAGETQPPRARRSFRNTVIVNVASYAVLTCMYLVVSPTSLATQVRPDPSLGFMRNVQATVYYLGNDGDVYSVRSNGSQRRKVASLSGADKRHRLALLLNESTGTVDVVSGWPPALPQPTTLPRSVGRAVAFPDVAPAGSQRQAGPERPLYDGRPNSRGRALDLRPVGPASEPGWPGTC